MKHISFLYFVSLLLLITSCKTKLYIPNGSNVPLLQEEKELKIVGSTGGNLQAAYAVTNHIGLMANGFWTYRSADDTDRPGNKKGEGSLVELGAGYFDRFNDFVFETYAGAGLGRLDYKDTENGKNYSSNGTRLFVQPNIGWTSKYIDIAISGRLAGLKYYDFLADGYSQEELDQEFLHKDLVEDNLWVFFEPAITLRGGYKYIKAQIQYGISKKLNSGDLKYDNTYFNVGFVFDLGNWYNQ
ncbi:MAG: hypothetical protein LC107_04585 [Chitinophagales bacterium]|nr:hypothetical protein [Chitinophagales bacterium]